LIIEILTQNKSSWDNMADDWFGTTALPVYGCLTPTEDELKLFGSLNGKKVLDIGCGSGHSLKWCGDNGAGELYGLDFSEKQLENAGRYLNENGYLAKLLTLRWKANAACRRIILILHIRYTQSAGQPICSRHFILSRQLSKRTVFSYFHGTIL